MKNCLTWFPVSKRRDPNENLWRGLPTTESKSTTGTCKRPGLTRCADGLISPNEKKKSRAHEIAGTALFLILTEGVVFYPEGIRITGLWPSFGWGFR